MDVLRKALELLRSSDANAEERLTALWKTELASAKENGGKQHRSQYATGPGGAHLDRDRDKRSDEPPKASKRPRHDSPTLHHGQAGKGPKSASPVAAAAASHRGAAEVARKIAMEKAKQAQAAAINKPKAVHVISPWSAGETAFLKQATGNAGNPAAMSGTAPTRGRPKPKDGKSRASPITTTEPPKSLKSPPKSPETDAGGSADAESKSWIKPYAVVMVDHSGDWFEAKVIRVGANEVEIMYRMDNSTEVIKGKHKIEKRIRHKNSMKKRVHANDDDVDLVSAVIRPPAKQRTRSPEKLLERQEAITGTKYLVKWAGFDDQENSWERESDLPKAIVAKFDAELQALKASKGKGSAVSKANVAAEDGDETDEDEEDTDVDGEDSYCDVCKGGDSIEGNAIVLCDGCDSAYHQDCHSPNRVTEEELDSEDLWFCSKPGCQAQSVTLNEEEVRVEQGVEQGEEQGATGNGDGLDSGDDWGSVEMVEETVESGEASTEKTANPLFSQQVTASPTPSAVNPMLKRLEEAEKKQLERQKHRKTTTAGSGRLQGMKRAMKRGSKTKRGRPLGK